MPACEHSGTPTAADRATGFPEPDPWFYRHHHVLSQRSWPKIGRRLAMGLGQQRMTRATGAGLRETSMWAWMQGSSGLAVPPGLGGGRNQESLQMDRGHRAGSACPSRPHPRTACPLCCSPRAICRDNSAGLREVWGPPCGSRPSWSCEALGLRNLLSQTPDPGPDSQGESSEQTGPAPSSRGPPHTQHLHSQQDPRLSMDSCTEEWRRLGYQI